MQVLPLLPHSHTSSYTYETIHILVAGLWRANKTSLLKHICDSELCSLDLVGDSIPADLPDLTMGEIRVDERLTARFWGAPDHWQHDYVSYLLNIRRILDAQIGNHRVMGMILVLDSCESIATYEEAKLSRLIEMDWRLPYMVLASHPDDPYARSIDEIRTAYSIPDTIDILPCDLDDSYAVNRAVIELLYRVM